MAIKHFTFSDEPTTVDQLLARLENQSEIVMRFKRDSRGNPIKWRITGKIKRWKRDPNRFYVPIKHGLREYSSIESLEEFNHSFAFNAWPVSE